MTHGALALHFSHKINLDLPPLTATNLFRAVEHTGITSPNTVTSYLKEIHARGYITLLPKADRRVRACAMTEFFEKMFYLYLQISLQGLDLIDGAGRADIASADPRILTHMHPIFARKSSMTRAILRALLLVPPASTPQLQSPSQTKGRDHRKRTNRM